MSVPNSALNINVWVMTDDCDVSTSEYKTDDDDHESNRTLFSRINNDIISKLLMKQKSRLRNEIATLEKNYNKQYHQLKHSIKEFNLGREGKISQCKLHSKFDCSVDFMNDTKHNIF